MIRRIVPLVLIVITAATSTACRRTPVHLALGPDPGAAAPPAALGDLPPERLAGVLYDLERRTLVASFNRRVPHIPASTTKLITAALARDLMGPDHRWTTTLYRTGGIDGGAVTGDLVLVGSGDPLLTAADLMAMADALAAEGVRRVAGRFLYDDTRLPARERVDPDMDADFPYNAGVSALSLDCNNLFAAWKRDQERGPLRPWLVPSLPAAEVAPGKTGTRDEPRFSYRFADGRASWTMNPAYGRQGPGRERLPVKDPSRFTAELFVRLCALRGIRLPAPVRSTEPAVMRPWHHRVLVHEGRSLDELAEVTLTYSNNVMAELMALSAAREITGRATDAEAAMRALADHLAREVRGVDWRSFVLANGSGLTSANRVTAEQMLGVLIWADERRRGDRLFHTLLPSSGWKWSLLTRLNEPDTAFRVWAKTGTINYATALAGYLFTRKGRRMAFVVFVSDPAARARFTADPARRSRVKGAAAEAWVKRSREIVDAIVTSWIRDH